jgi:mannitol/fructose-specific phosphotransferase system IIA component (Ntr-type)
LDHFSTPALNPAPLSAAIRHARCPNLASPLIVIGRSADGIPFGDPSSEPMRLLFLLVTPAERPDLQVLLLSRIAGVAGNAAQRRRLIEAVSMSDVKSILVETK